MRIKNIFCLLGLHNYKVTGVTTAATFHPKHNAIYVYYCKCERKNCGKAKEVVSKSIRPNNTPKHEKHGNN